MFAEMFQMQRAGIKQRSSGDNLIILNLIIVNQREIRYKIYLFLEMP